MHDHYHYHCHCTATAIVVQLHCVSGHDGGASGTARESNISRLGQKERRSEYREHSAGRRGETWRDVEGKTGLGSQSNEAGKQGSKDGKNERTEPTDQRKYFSFCFFSATASASTSTSLCLSPRSSCLHILVTGHRPENSADLSFPIRFDAIHRNPNRPEPSRDETRINQQQRAEP